MQNKRERFLSFPNLRRGRSGPLSDVSDETLFALEALFDVGHYAKSLEEKGLDAKPTLDHYIEFGWREGISPSASFDTKFYIENNPDVRNANMPPLLHYVLSGKKEGRLPMREHGDKSAFVADQQEIEQQKLAVQSDFDVDYYLKENPDVADAGADPIEHYLRSGWLEGRDPSPSFDTNFYLSEYPDIATNNIQPFVHYVAYGRSEGRLGSAGEVLMLPTNPQAELVAEPSVRAMVDLALREKTDPVSPPERCDPNKLDIHWVIPGFGVGGGGHMTIFRFVRYFELQGHQCTVWVQNDQGFSSIDEAFSRCNLHYQAVRAQFRWLDESFFQAQGDALIATSYATTFPVSEQSGFRSKFYFVQDHEKEFYPTGSRGILAEASYRYDFHCLCASPWLRQKMRDQYGRRATAFYLAASSEYTLGAESLDERTERLKYSVGVPRVAVYARGHTDRRCVELVFAALEILSKRGVDFEVDFFGDNKLMFSETPFIARNHGVLKPEDLGALYRQCDIGVCFSGTNYSLVPQEMMSCGLPLLELDTASTRAIFPDEVVSFAGPMPADIARQLEQLICDPEGRAEQAVEAYRWVSKFSWDKSGKTVLNAIHNDVTATTKAVFPTDDCGDVYDVDICIPTWNGLEDLQKLLPKLYEQKSPYTFKIWVCDSSSTDGTFEWLSNHAQVNLFQIDQTDFQHGRTRNLLASKGSGRFIAFLTQDALPYDKFWLHNLVCVLDHSPNVAGVFGRHIPYGHHSVFRKREILEHFNMHDEHGVLLCADSDRERWENGDQSWRQILHYYSDNSSCMRRDVWEKIPYQEIPYGEDQVWARDIIEAGYTKGYAPKSVVIHSHDFDVLGTLKRCETEGAFFKSEFGYRLAPSSPEEALQYMVDYKRFANRIGLENSLGPDQIFDELKIKAATLIGWHMGQHGQDPDYDIDDLCSA